MWIALSPMPVKPLKMAAGANCRCTSAPPHSTNWLTCWSNTKSVLHSTKASMWVNPLAMPSMPISRLLPATYVALPPMPHWLWALRVPIKGHFAYLRRKPIGVVAGIAGWNFPLVLAAGKMAPALIMGNTIVLKPSEFTSLSAQHLAALAIEAGIPPGVFNVVHGAATPSVMLWPNTQISVCSPLSAAVPPVNALCNRPAKAI